MRMFNSNLIHIIKYISINIDNGNLLICYNTPYYYYVLYCYNTFMSMSLTLNESRY